MRITVALITAVIKMKVKLPFYRHASAKGERNIAPALS
jgi:hypothetical protein